VRGGAVPRFKVEIHGTGLEHALTALNQGGVPTMGPTFTWIEGSADTARVGRQMSAYLDTESGEAAEARVRETLPADGDFTVKPAERVETV
jgi:hypothetical protein